MYNTVWISTTPRTGSMWTFNVTRELLATAGNNVLPSVVPQSDEEMFGCYDMALKDETQANRYCMKVHTVLKENIKKSKVITTIRDPRDVCLSFKNFMKCDFNHALRAGKDLIRYTEIYECYNPEYITFVRYEDISGAPYNALKIIDVFLKLHTSEADINCIAEKYSKENVKNIIDRTTNNLSDKILKHKEIDKKEIVGSSTGNYRAFDVKTGFQTGHISGNSSGDWKVLFSKEEQIILEDAFGDFCQRYGYK